MKICPCVTEPAARASVAVLLAAAFGPACASGGSPYDFVAPFDEAGSVADAAPGSEVSSPSTPSLGGGTTDNDASTDTEGGDANLPTAMGACGPSCGGCCNAAGACAPGTVDEACGSGGVSCLNCAVAGANCQPGGTCALDSGASSGGSPPSGSSGGSVDGSPGAACKTGSSGSSCAKGTCTGCCDSSGNCHPGTSNSNCGAKSECCTDCTTAGKSCSAGSCT